MNIEKANEIIQLYKSIERIPQSKERDEALQQVSAKLKDMIREQVMGFCSLGESIGFDFIRKTLEETKEMIESTEKLLKESIK